MNKWLTSAVNTYIEAYGRTMHPVIYEVGSRDGHDAVELATRIAPNIDIWKHGTIVAFEPNPQQIPYVISNYPKITLITEAIAQQEGIIDFVQIEGDRNERGSSSFDKRRLNVPWGKTKRIIKVKTRTLASVIEELGHQKRDIDIMKIDIEGYTWEALESMGEYLRNVRVFHLETEIDGVAVNKTNLDIAYYMQQKGYICTTIEHEWGPTIQDQVWVRSES